MDDLESESTQRAPLPARDSEIIAAGLDHHTAPIDLREPFVLPAGAGEEMARSLIQQFHLAECAILSTCNRTEVYAAGPGAALPDILPFFARKRGVDPARLPGHSYTYRGVDAVYHLSRVAAGLSSMVVGEGQILGQVKGAIEAAAAAHTSGPVLSALFRQAVTAGRRARSETTIMRGAVSISHAAVELAQQIFGQLSGCRALVLGAGEMSEITLKLLRSAGMHTSIMISNRTPERAHALAERCQGIGVEWERFPQALEEADIVIVSTSAPHIIVKNDMVRQAMKARRGRHMFIIDISVPRNVDPEAGQVRDVFLYNIDDLQGVVQRNLGDRRREVERVERIVVEEAERFEQWLKGLQVVPAIVGLRAHAENVRQQEWDRFAGRMSHLPQRDLEAVEAMTRQLINKLLHRPVVQLKELGVNGKGFDRVEVVRELFGLPDEPPAGPMAPDDDRGLAPEPPGGNRDTASSTDATMAADAAAVSPAGRRGGEHAP